MHKFAVIEIIEISGKLKIFKLLIDEICLYDEFEKEIIHEGNYLSELRTIITRLHEIAHNRLLPEKKFRDITPRGAVNKEYEISMQKGLHKLRMFNMDIPSDH